MDAQSVIADSRLVHVRELKARLKALQSENQRLASENAALKSHLELAALASVELSALPERGRLRIVDGWNRILASDRSAADRTELEAWARGELDLHPDDRIWIVYDGPKWATTVTGRLRVSYTGGEGPQRADRFIGDFLRLAAYLGLSERVEVVSSDRDLRREVERLGGKVVER